LRLRSKTAIAVTIRIGDVSLQSILIQHQVSMACLVTNPIMNQSVATGDATGLSLRKATAADLREVLRLYAQPDFYDGVVPSESEALVVFERMAAYPDYVLYVAECDGAVVGTFALLVMDNIGHMGTPSAVIEDVAVDPALHGAGIGRWLMAQALEISRAKGCYKLVLSSNVKREKAHAFYDALDFERHGYSFRIHLT
jgi:GNAT superfamily N-acetyltransferase